jgi:hypothetical protein
MLNIFSSSIFGNNQQQVEDTTTTTTEVPQRLDELENALDRLKRMLDEAKKRQAQPPSVILPTPDPAPHAPSTPRSPPIALPLGEGREEEGGFIDLAIRCQFHQHFTCSFFVQKFWVKLFCAYTLGLNFFWSKNMRKCAHKMLVKLTTAS